MTALSALLFLALASCSGSQHGGRGSPEELGCTQDPAARSTCEAKGSGYIYGAEPDFLCGGNDPGPEGQKEITAARHARACACMTTADYQQREHECTIAP